MTVRQIFSDDPARKIQASFPLRRSPLSHTAAAWPCHRVLMNPAPLSGAIQFSNILAQKISIVNPLFAYFVLLYKIFVHHRDTFDIYSIICYYFPYMGGVILKRAELRFLSAMGIFGTIGIFVRYIPLSSSAVAFSRAVLGLAFLAAVMFFTKN